LLITFFAAFHPFFACFVMFRNFFLHSSLLKLDAPYSLPLLISSARNGYCIKPGCGNLLLLFLARAPTMTHAISGNLSGWWGIK
jgi:hypothetical protein